MKRVLTVILILVLSLPPMLFMGGDGLCVPPPEKEPAPPPTEVVEEKEEEPVVIDSYPYDLSVYVTLPSPYGVVASFDEPGACTPEEVQEAVDQIRLALATFEEKEGVVERFDKVTLSFQVMLGGQEDAALSAPETEIIVGQDGIDGEKAALAQALSGAAVGELRWTDYTFPESVLEGDYAGKTVIVKGVVKKIERAILPEVDLDFVQAMEGFEDATVDAFYASVETDVLARKEEERISAVWTAFCRDVAVLGYPEAELQAYCEDYRSYYTEFARALGMELDVFLTEYMETDGAGFEKEMELYAKEMVKNDMIFTQLVRVLEITLTPEEYRAGLKAYFEKDEAGLPSIEDYEAYYTKEQIWENLLRDKALLSMVENAVRAE
ncbi:MAG: hypothetical protein IKJ74_02960 [Clostridia bacterium]|nr:hypothetical protein [Clostridia bacterium]